MKFKFKYVSYTLKGNFKNEEIIRPISISLNDTQNERVISNYISETYSLFSEYGFIYEALENNDLNGDICLQSWGGQILENDIVEIYFSFDSDNRDYIAQIPRKDLLILLYKWRDFLQRVPDLEYEEIIDLDEINKKEQY